MSHPPDSPTPIFVIGRHRSGTTWVANALSAYDGVYAPRHEAHRGVHESAFFSHLVPHCRGGRTPADMLQIKELFERSDFYLLTGLSRGPDILRHGYAGYFRQVMDASALAHGARYWLEKTPSHTLHARFLSRAFPDAVIMAVVRRTSDVVASNVHGFGNPGSAWTWFRQALATRVYERVARRNAALVVRYEDLCDDFSGTLRRIAKRLGLGDAVPADAQAFVRNTSFAGEIPRLRWWQSAAINTAWLLASLVPGPALDFAVEFWRARKREATLPGWFFLVSRGGQECPERRP